MHSLFKLSKMLLLTCLFTHFSICGAAEQTNAITTTPSPASESSVNSNTNAELVKNLTDSAHATKSWLDLIDKEKYGESWDAGSKLMRSTVKRNEWAKVLTKSRKPLGELKTRSVLDQRTAKDPKNLPKGDYMVMFYNSSFANKALAYELVTLYKESDGQWRVITYQVD